MTLISASKWSYSSILWTWYWYFKNISAWFWFLTYTFSLYRVLSISSSVFLLKKFTMIFLAACLFRDQLWEWKVKFITPNRQTNDDDLIWNLHENKYYHVIFKRTSRLQKCIKLAFYPRMYKIISCVINDWFI